MVKVKKNKSLLEESSPVGKSPPPSINKKEKKKKMKSNEKGEGKENKIDNSIAKKVKNLPKAEQKNLKSDGQQQKKEKKQKNKAEMKGEKEKTKEAVKEKKEEITEPQEVKLMEKSKIVEGVSAFRQLLSHRQKSTEDQKSTLFDDGPRRIHLQVSGIKVVSDNDKCQIKARLPNSSLAEDSDVLLIVKDMERGIKPDHENTLLHYQNLLKEKGVTSISEVMPMRQLRVEYKEFEAKLQLCNRFDKVLVDERIIRLIPTFLGNIFYKKNKFPISVCLTKKNLKDEIDRCIRTELMQVSTAGSCSTVIVGHPGLKEEQLTDNAEVAIRAIEARYPGGWKNVRSVHIACASVSLPLYFTDRSRAEVGKVETHNAHRLTKEAVTDELSTIPGATVTVFPSGIVNVHYPKGEKSEEKKRKRGLKKKESTEEDTEDITKEEEEEEEEEVKPKMRKMEERKNKKKSKKKKEEEEEESDDDLEDLELEYMRKVAEEEEEIERKEQENMEKLGETAVTDKKKAVNDDEKEEDDEEEDEDDDDESVADDDIEADNLLSDDDDDEEGGDDDNIIMDKPDDFDEDDEQPKKKKLSKKALKKKHKNEAKEAKAKAQKKGKGTVAKKGGEKPQKKGKDKVKDGKIKKKKK